MMNLFIVGAAKAGTTSLFYYLEQSSEIISPRIKEPHFFSHINNNENVVFPNGHGIGDKNTPWIFNEKEYLNLFPIEREESNKGKYFLDAAVTNLYSNTASSEIRKFDSDAKIIIMLRNPIDRAWSHYNHLVRDGREKLPFEKSLEEEESRIEQNWEFSWHLKKMGLYHDQLKRYLNNFPENQIKIVLFEEFIENTEAVVTEVSDFLNLSNFKVNIDKTHNVSGRSKSPLLASYIDKIAGQKKIINKFISPKITHKLMQKFRKINVKEHSEEMNDKTRNYLRDYFADDITKTEKLIKKNLSNWN